MKIDLIIYYINAKIIYYITHFFQNQDTPKLAYHPIFHTNPLFVSFFFTPQLCIEYFKCIYFLFTDLDLFTLRFGELKTSQDMYDFLGNVTEYNGYIWLPCFATYHLNDICLKAFHNFNISSPTAVLANPDHFVKIMKFWKERNHTKLLSSGKIIIIL